jgi:hypothetical protein
MPPACASPPRVAQLGPCTPPQTTPPILDHTRTQPSTTDTSGCAALNPFDQRPRRCYGTTEAVNPAPHPEPPAKTSTHVPTVRHTLVADSTGAPQSRPFSDIRAPPLPSARSDRTGTRRWTAPRHGLHIPSSCPSPLYIYHYRPLVPPWFPRTDLVGINHPRRTRLENATSE